MRRAAAVAVIVLTACGSQSERNGQAESEPGADNAVLQAALLEMGRIDQAVRDSLTIGTAADTALLKRIAAVDSANTQQLDELVARHGWPDRSRVGIDAAEAAFLVVQHSPSHDFQERMLELLRAAAERGEADRSDVAMLTDRVLVHEGRPQLYGTQFRIEHGQLVPYPIADVEGVDAARAAMGLMPMREYVAALRERYGGPVAWPDSVPADSTAG